MTPDDDEAEELRFDDEPRRRLEDDPLARLALPIGRSPWAIAAGYLGLISLLGFPAPFAILFSVIAIRDIRRNPKHRGMGRAIFGLLMGLAGMVILAAILIAIFAGPQQP